MLPALRFLFAMSLLSLLGCSRTSTELPSSLSGLRVEISIEDLTTCTAGSNYSRKSIRAVLRHARGSAIERGDVGLEVNGVPMQFRVGQGNYYDRHPYYALEADARLPLAPATDHRFTLVMPDGARHDVGSVQTPAAMEVKQFDFPAQRPETEKVGIAWRALKEPALLTLFRSDLRKEPDGTQVLVAGSATDPEGLRRTIGPGWFRRDHDRWPVPEDFLAPRDGNLLRALGAEIVVVNKGRVLSTFAKESTLSAERRVTMDMEFLKTE